LRAAPSSLAGDACGERERDHFNLLTLNEHATRLNEFTVLGSDFINIHLFLGASDVDGSEPEVLSHLIINSGIWPLILGKVWRKKKIFDACINNAKAEQHLLAVGQCPFLRTRKPFGMQGTRSAICECCRYDSREAVNCLGNDLQH
jgi:hypothetical protein